MADKPMGVMPICIIAIALGVMGFFGGAVGLVGLLINPKTASPAENDPKLTALNAEFQERIQKVAKETRPFQLLLIPAMMASSLLLAGAAIGGIKLRGRGFLQAAFGVALIVDTVGALYGMIVQFKTIEIMKWFFREMAGSSKVHAGVEMGMQVGLYVGLFFGVGWLVAKTVFFLLGLIYFGKRNIREAFAAAA